MATRWARNVLQACLGLRPGERVLALVDEPLRHAGGALCVAAAELGASQAATRVLPVRMGPLLLVPESLLRQVQEADVIVSLLSTLEPGQEPAALRAAVAAFRSAARGRWAFGAFVDDDVLEHELSADLQAVAARTERLAARLAGVEQVRLTTAAGTDLTLRIGGRPIHRETGVLTEPGALGNLPAGEVFVAPLESSAEGRLVVDLCLGDLHLASPVTLTFRQGRAVDVAGGPEAAELRRRLGTDPWGWTVGEFGIGTNPYARILRRVTVDEKRWGTAHVALGSNLSFGGCNPAGTHYDCVVDAPEISLDGSPLRWEDADRPSLR
jgi:hypothetical protein